MKLNKVTSLKFINTQFDRFIVNYNINQGNSLQQRKKMINKYIMNKNINQPLGSFMTFIHDHSIC